MLENFGLNAGIAFQITDDLLDLVGDEGRTGKTVGSDVDKNKLTLPVIHLLRVADDSEREEVYNVLNIADGGGRGKLLKMLRSHGSFEYAHKQAQEFVTKAVHALADFGESDDKTRASQSSTRLGGAQAVAGKVCL